MHLRNQIEATFEGRAFQRPLFYSYPKGLRFELSEGGSAIEQFLSAMQKATAICADIFSAKDPLTVCLRTRLYERQYGLRPVLTELHSAGIRIPKQRCIWVEVEAPVEEVEGDEPEQWLNVAFELPARFLQNLLWCALATDLGSIHPNPHCTVYLFNMQKRLLVLPYDDRGMDVVGPNHQLLSSLYFRHHLHLLEYDRERMQETFGPSNPSIERTSPGKPDAASHLKP